MGEFLNKLFEQFSQLSKKTKIIMSHLQISQKVDNLRRKWIQKSL